MTIVISVKFAETEMRSCARQAETDGRPSEDLLAKIKGLDLISLIIPEDFGGMGLAQDSVSNALTLEALAYGDLSLAMSISAPLLTAQIILNHGSEDQKSEYLPQLADGSIFNVSLGINNASVATDPYQSSVTANESGDEVIVPGFMWISSISAIIRASAIAFLASVCPTIKLSPTLN